MTKAEKSSARIRPRKKSSMRWEFDFSREIIVHQEDSEGIVSLEFGGNRVACDAAALEDAIRRCK